MKVKNLKLIARTEEDLRVVSAHLQDSIASVSDIANLKKNKIFLLQLNRFMWEDIEKGVFRKNKRIRSILKFENVLNVGSKNINQLKKEINIIFNKIAKKEKYSRYIEIDNLDFNLKFIINLESELYNGDTTNEELFFKLLKKIIKYFKENGENFSTNLFKEGINDSCFSNFDKKKTKYYRTKKEMKCLFYSSSCKK